jgi:peptidoglycan/LPS O-acetylase OafA/YrhL
MKAAWVVVIADPAIRAILWFGFHASDSAMTKHFEAIADTLATGCLLSMNFNRIGATRWYQRFQSSRLFWIVSLGLVLGGDGLYAVNPACFYVIGQSVANLGTALCIDWSICNFGRGVGHVLNWRPIVYIGVLSYSLYLWQNAFLNPDWNAWPTKLPTNILLASGMAIASYYLVEKPFLRLKRFAMPGNRKTV